MGEAHRGPGEGRQGQGGWGRRGEEADADRDRGRDRDSSRHIERESGGGKLRKSAHRIERG